eukprot:3438144-Rhodomonas_salina.2
MHYGSADGQNRLVPLIDIAWIWHLYSLAPQRYAEYCQQRFGRILDPGPGGAFTAQHEDITFLDASIV